MKLELNMVAVEWLNEMADILVREKDEIGQDTIDFYDHFSSLEEGLGVHQSDFYNMLAEIIKAVGRFENSVLDYESTLRKIAQAIDDYIHHDAEDIPHTKGTRVRSLYTTTSSSRVETDLSGSAKTQMNGPRDLPVTKQIMEVNSSGGKTYNTPSVTGKSLDYRQGKAAGYQGTCGLCSCENILRLAGVDVSEQDIVEFAIKSGLCTDKSCEEENGGTNYLDRKEILDAFGIASSLFPQELPVIEKAVISGRGVIISVDAGCLWGDASYLNKLHAVTVTSVDYDKEGRLENFHICDSGAGNYDMIVPADKLQSCLITNRKMNVTQQIIR